jgi:hypothetical protein
MWRRVQKVVFDAVACVGLARLANLSGLVGRVGGTNRPSRPGQRGRSDRPGRPDRSNRCGRPATGWAGRVCWSDRPNPCQICRGCSTRLVVTFTASACVDLSGPPGVLLGIDADLEVMCVPHPQPTPPNTYRVGWVFHASVQIRANDGRRVVVSSVSSSIGSLLRLRTVLTRGMMSHRVVAKFSRGYDIFSSRAGPCGCKAGLCRSHNQCKLC